MMGMLHTLRDLLLPPRCVGCGKRLPPILSAGGTSYFCSDCVKGFQKCLLSQCPECFAPYYDCRCQPRIMERAGSQMLIKLAPYGREGIPTTVDYAIRNIKHHPRFRTVACLARELAPALRKYLARQPEMSQISHTVITFLPRSHKKIRQFGFDQAKELARELARITGLEYSALLVRVRDGDEQKGLTVKERQENMKGMFRARDSAKGLRVILVDDVVTTGAGMAEGVRVLRAAGAAEIVSVAVAMTEKKRRSKD